MPLVERPDLTPSDWDMNVFDEKVECPVEIVDEFEDMPGNSDYWHLDSGTAMELGEDFPPVMEGSRDLQSVRVGGEGSGVEWATWTCSLSIRQLEKFRQEYEQNWDSLDDLSFEWILGKELAYLHSMIVHDRGWKPRSASTDDYTVRIELHVKDTKIRVRIVFTQNEYHG